MKKLLNKITLLMALDVVSIVVAFAFSCYFSGDVFSWADWTWLFALTFAVIIKIAIFVRLGLYRAVLRYASLDFLVAVLKAVSLGSIGLVFTLYIIRFHLNPKTLVLDWLLTVSLIGGSRFVGRYYLEIIQRFRKGKRVLIYGAGGLGVMALKQLSQNKMVLYTPIGFLDDDEGKKGKTINGLEVFGTLDDLGNTISNKNIEELIVAIADISTEKLRDIVKRCRRKKVVCRILPCFSKMMEFEPMMRKVEIADLMRRTPRDLDDKVVRDFIKGKRVLVTGAAGSIGSELVRQCLKCQPNRVVVLDQSENGLYALSEELGYDIDIEYVLGDVTNQSDMDRLFKNQEPQIVFHAAAYKHVPMLETNYQEAINNNVGGTKNIADMSNKYGVKKFVLISTDKAVRPKSVMGYTKRACELYIQSYNGNSETDFVAVRFGNVLGSSGSVIPKFIEQIKKGGPVTVTDPETTRYFMLIDEAVKLVLQAAAIGKGGEIMILNMGKPVKISEMAEDLIYLMGREPHKEIKIEYTGMRPGEKIYEELFNEEIEKPTSYNDISIGKTVKISREEVILQVREILKSKTVSSLIY